MHTFKIPRTPWRARLAFALGFMACAAVPLAQAGETYSVTLAFEADGLDLDSGALTSALEPSGEPDTSDIRIAYNALRPVAAVVMPAGEGVELAFLSNTGMNAVSSASLADLSFSAQAPDIPFTVFDTVVVKTDSGAYYKLGNASEQAETLTFDYQLIE
jgi:hypothetical protein